VRRTMAAMVGECLRSTPLEPMSDEEYAEFRERSQVSYAAATAASCRFLRLVARPPRTKGSYCRRDLRTPDHYLWTAYEGDEPVGDLWLHAETKPVGFTPLVTGSRCAQNFASADTVGR
jgi:hypothetical protein